MAAYLSAEEGRVVDLTDDATRARLDDYVPLIQQGRGAEVLAMPTCEGLRSRRRTVLAPSGRAP